MAYMIKTGDPCPCCGQPIQITDPHALLNLSLLAELMGFSMPEPGSTEGSVLR